MAGHRINTFRTVAGVISAWSLGIVFLLFVIGIGMRYIANRPLSWIDEAVTLLSVWSTFWTAAFVLRWPDHIAFDVLYSSLKPMAQRLCLIIGIGGFVAIMVAALPGMVDYTLFLWRERTDAMQLRLDWVYSIYPAFFFIVLLRLAYSLYRLLTAGWKGELDHWAGAGEEASE